MFPIFNGDLYVDTLNTNCETTEYQRVTWIVTDLEPDNVRTYCNINDKGLCNSCSRTIEKFKSDFNTYRLNLLNAMRIFAEVQQDEQNNIDPAIIQHKLDQLLASDFYANEKGGYYTPPN